nr:hypothetical protein [Spiribacter sp. 2438]
MSRTQADAVAAHHQHRLGVPQGLSGNGPQTRPQWAAGLAGQIKPVVAGQAGEQWVTNRRVPQRYRPAGRPLDHGGDVPEHARVEAGGGPIPHPTAQPGLDLTRHRRLGQDRNPDPHHEPLE